MGNNEAHIKAEVIKALRTSKMSEAIIETQSSANSSTGYPANIEKPKPLHLNASGACPIN